MAEEASGFDRASRLVAIMAASVLVLQMAWLGAHEWHGLLPVTIVSAAAAAAISRVRPDLAAWLSLPLVYVSPALILMFLGHSRNAYQAPLLGAVLGLSLSTGVRRAWALPYRWRLPLAWWSLTVAFSAVIITMRELDFDLALYDYTPLANSAVGGPPKVVIAWVSYVAAVYLVGILWFDSFFSRYRMTVPTVFRNQILVPLGISAIAGAALASYQGLVDIHWLSGHGWDAQGRAAGGLVDGDAFGALAGFWTGIFLALGVSGGWPLRLFAATGFLVSWMGLWASGSRMALLAGLLSTGGSLVLITTPVLRRHPRRVLASGFAVLVIAAAFSTVDFGWQTSNPLSRTIQSLPAPSPTAIAGFIEHQFWNRDAPFGSAFLLMMRDHPMTGVGIGSFHTLYPDYAYLVTGRYGVAENAQSWYRHQLAELGLLGSGGWIWCAGLIAILVLRRQRNDSLEAKCLRATLVAIGVVSAISMPTQHAAVALTVWPLLFAFLRFSATAQDNLTQPVQVSSRRGWMMIWAASLVFFTATAVVAWRSLRPPLRAVQANWTYSRGFGAPEGGQGQPFRWTGKYAVEVPHMPAPWLRLAIGGGPPDIASNPIRVTVKRNGRRIIDYMLNNRAGHTWWVRAPDGPPRMMIEIEVDRVWSPADYGGGDSRQLGVSVLAWQFSNVPPRNADSIR